MVRDLAFFFWGAFPSIIPMSAGMEGIVWVGSAQHLSSTDRIYARDSCSLWGATSCAVILKDTKHPPNVSTAPLGNLQAKRNYKNHYSYNDQTA